MNEHNQWLDECIRLQQRLSDLPPAQIPLRDSAGVLTLALSARQEIPEVHSIMRAAFAEYIGVLFPTPSAATATLEDVNQALLEGGAVIGRVAGEAVASSLFRLRQDHLYIGRLAVLPDRRGCGIASAILGYMETIARRLDLPELRLGTRLSLPRNIALYQRHGYEVVSTVKFTNSSDTIVWLSKRLKPQ